MKKVLSRLSALALIVSSLTVFVIGANCVHSKPVRGNDVDYFYADISANIHRKTVLYEEECNKCYDVIGHNTYSYDEGHQFTLTGNAHGNNKHYYYYTCVYCDRDKTETYSCPNGGVCIVINSVGSQTH